MSEREIWARVSAEACRYASHYSEASDGRNTFILFAEWADRQSAAAPAPLTEQDIEVAVGGTYEMPDGRKFWNDVPVAREIARRVWERMTR